MQTYIALLRGINVSGQKKILMEELRQVLSGLGFAALRTYIQSGNIIFRHRKTKPAKLAAMIAEAILAHYGFDVAVIVRTPEELAAALAHNPFAAAPDSYEKGLYIAFLDAPPDPLLAAKIPEASYLPDRYAIEGAEVYLAYALGAGNTKLTNSVLEKKLQRTATSRNLNTVRELIRLSAME